MTTLLYASLSPGTCPTVWDLADKHAKCVIANLFTLMGRCYTLEKYQSLRGVKAGERDVQMMDRLDWLVVFLGLPEEKFPTDQLRAMKGFFLFTKEGPREVADLYDFRAYDYGPFTAQLYYDLDELRTQGLVQEERGASASQRIFKLTPAGEERFAALMAHASQPALASLQQIKRVTSSLGFIELLRYVYGKYPEYAVRSIARL